MTFTFVCTRNPKNDLCLKWFDGRVPLKSKTGLHMLIKMQDGKELIIILRVSFDTLQVLFKTPSHTTTHITSNHFKVAESDDSICILTNR